MADKPKVELVIAEATKIEPGNRLIVCIDPRWGDLVTEIDEALNHFGVEALILPVPAKDIRFWQIGPDVRLEMAPALEQTQ